MTDKTHFRKVFDSPYLSAADIVEPTELTILKVVVEPDKTKKTKDLFNTLYFVEQEIRQGEKLKPMILNATNSKTLHKFTKLPFIEDWAGFGVTVFVDSNVRFGRETVEGLRIHGRTVDKKPVEYINTEQIGKLHTLIEAAGKTTAVICASLGVATMENIPLSKFQNVCNRLEATIKEVSKNEHP